MFKTLRLATAVTVAAIAYANCPDGSCRLAGQTSFCVGSCCYSFVNIDCCDYSCTASESVCQSGSFSYTDNCP